MFHNTVSPDIETASADYRSRFAGPVGSYFLETQRKATFSLLQRFGPRVATPGSKLRVLELGGGHAQLTPHLLAAGHAVTVQGSEASCFTWLKNSVETAGKPVRFVESNLWKLPFENGEFDCLIAVRLLAHVERWQDLLEEMTRVSKFLIVDYPSIAALNRLTPWLFVVKKQIEGNTRPYFSYRDADIYAALGKFGFSTLGVERQFVLPMGLHRALGKASGGAGISAALEAAAGVCGLRRAFGSPVLLAAGSLAIDS